MLLHKGESFVKEPKVSVIMPSYNKEAFIEKAIWSVLKQTMIDLELIIVDDCSKDHSAELIRGFNDKRIRFYENEVNIGMAANRNKGIELARGEYIALLDADDISPNYRLEHEADFLDKHLDIDVVYGGCQEIDENNIDGALYISTLHNPNFIRAMLTVRDVIPNGSTMFRKTLVDKHGLRFEDGMQGMDDYLFWVKCSIYGNICGIPETMLYWRNYNNNTTNTVMNEELHSELRKMKYAEIQKIALSLNGFTLDISEIDFYTNILTEKTHRIENHDEMRRFLDILKKLIRQSEEMNKGTEWKIMFKKQFGRVMEHAYLWD